MMTFRAILLLLAIISTGLMGGLFFAWTVSVIPGTARTSDQAYVSTMQHINRAIVNPGFVVPFMGVPAILGLAAYLQWRVGEIGRARLLVGAAAVYLFGVLGVTAGGNIPLNNALDAFDLDNASTEALARQRLDYEGPWNRWHYVRTVASVLALSLAAATALVGEE